MAHVVRECIRPEIVAHTAGIRSVSNMGVWLRGYRDGVESVEMTRGWLVAGIEERGCRRQNARREVAWLARRCRVGGEKDRPAYRGSKP